ncbi:Eco57I restriction-modification methylase domain-containing protein [Haloferax volcanii]|uniref:Eco57I restriction-modification methylase domain-containing protein n=1 Tax=Haloferax volcanii TaxID=2246 RepID=UPI0023DC9FD5|nr:N-6 DNA methylase [Haloferax lucentense]WEL27343.1 Adenine-specific DNA methylase [Haloferax lucentense]
MVDDFVSDVRDALVSISEEIDEEGGEFDFRYSLVDHLFVNALGWTREEGQGHVRVGVRGDRNDVLFYDDSNPPIPVVDCETKRPAKDLDIDDFQQLETYVKALGSAKYGVLTNGKELVLYDYNRDKGKLSSIIRFDITEIASLDESEELSSEQKAALQKLELIKRDRFVNIGDAKYFRTHYQEIPVEYRPEAEDFGYDLFLQSIRDSLTELTSVLEEFFQDYEKRDSFVGEFLETAFENWVEWRQYTGTENDDARETFCRETAYILLNRALFARIAEDKEIVGRTKLSWQGMADVIEGDAENPYLFALQESYRQIEQYYRHLYELNVFDWWWVSRDRRQRFSSDERERQTKLEDKLDYTLRDVLKRLNRFDFNWVNRDILGHIYEDYLPQEERKRLGEYYTPVEVVQFMLDSVDYTPGNDIDQKQVLDPSCGSGTFLTVVADRLIDHYKDKFDRESIYELDSEQAKIILDKIQENVYGIDINPFATHITEINLLFQTIDLYDIARDDPNYTIGEFEIHCADTLMPTKSEWRDSEAEFSSSNERQSKLNDFQKFNGRAEAFVEDLVEVERIKDEESFDLIVANPPYVKTDNIGEMKDVYYSTYSSAVKDRNFDLYVPFIQRGLDWLTDDGKLTYICPNRLVNADYAESIRSQLGEVPISQFIDFKDVNVFDVSTPYPCIFNVDFSSETEQNIIPCARFSDEMVGDQQLDRISHLKSWETPDGVSEYELFHVPQSQLVEDNQDDQLSSWKIMPDRERRVFDVIEQNAGAHISDFRDEVFEGLITGRDRVFIGKIIDEVDDKHVEFEPKGSNRENISDSAIVERSVLRRVLYGKNVEPWGIDWEGYWAITPYNIVDGKAILISDSELDRDYEKTWEYLKEHKSILESRTGTNEWWAFTRPRPSTMFRPNKMIGRVMAQEPTFVADPSNEYIFVGGGTAGGYGVLMDDSHITSSDDLLRFVALMNSKILEYYVKQTSSIFGDKHYSHNQRYLDPVPIKIPDKQLSDELAKRATVIRDTHSEITDLQYKSSDIQHYLTEVDQESSILDIAQTIELTGDDYRQDPIRKDDRMEVNAETVHDLVMKRGHTITFKSRDARDFVYLLLKSQQRRLNRTEIINMSVPSKSNISKIMKEYKTDLEKIEQLSDDVKQKENDLDNIIATDLYSLDDEEVAVVDEFLQVW